MAVWQPAVRNWQRTHLSIRSHWGPVTRSQANKANSDMKYELDQKDIVHFSPGLGMHLNGQLNQIGFTSVCISVFHDLNRLATESNKPNAPTIYVLPRMIQYIRDPTLYYDIPDAQNNRFDLVIQIPPAMQMINQNRAGRQFVVGMLSVFTEDYLPPDPTVQPPLTRAETAHALGFMLEYNVLGQVTGLTILEPHSVRSGFVNDYDLPPVANQLANFVGLNQVMRIYGGQGATDDCYAHALGMLALIVKDPRMREQPGPPAMPGRATEVWTRQGPPINIPAPFPDRFM